MPVIRPKFTGKIKHKGETYEWNAYTDIDLPDEVIKRMTPTAYKTRPAMVRTNEPKPSRGELVYKKAGWIAVVVDGDVVMNTRDEEQAKSKLSEYAN